MKTCKNPKCNTKLGRNATSEDGLCRDCRGPKGAKERAAQKKRQMAIKPQRFCDCGVEISSLSKTGKCKDCLQKKFHLCVNPHCKAQVRRKDSFCRSCFTTARLGEAKDRHTGFCLSLKNKS